MRYLLLCWHTPERCETIHQLIHEYAKGPPVYSTAVPLTIDDLRRQILLSTYKGVGTCIRLCHQQVAGGVQGTLQARPASFPCPQQQTLWRRCRHTSNWRVAEMLRWLVLVRQDANKATRVAQNNMTSEQERNKAYGHDRTSPSQKRGLLEHHACRELFV